ncbi:MAG TPA: efflux RND transporter periplasmic adaptor subunit [Vicinamibacteria bacterium]|nr:efflux RND transporter periplasmic adaptor subunit [Vicinamibacteria bacterium]
MKQKRLGLVVAGLAVLVVVYAMARSRATTLVLTGIVTTNDVIVAPQVGGQLGKLLVAEGNVVSRGQLLAVIVPDELRADRDYYAHSAESYASQVGESAASLRYQEQQAVDQIRQAEANLAAAVAQRAQAAADLENERLTLARNRDLSGEGVVSAQDFDRARTTFDSAQARVEALDKQIEAQRAAVALARSSAEQTAARRSGLASSEAQRAAAAAQRAKADVRLAYAEVRAPIDGLVDVRAARLGEVVAAGQAILTLIDPDDLWVRIDVEETYIDGVRLGDHMKVRLPSGDEREGVVVFRGADAGFATQRDVSRTKRDIKTFEVRLRVDNRDRRLAVGMTAYALLPVTGR